MRKFAKVFPNNLLGIPPEWEIDFGINMLLDINPIAIPLYWMTQAELNESKAQIKDVLYKGFIRTSISPWVLRYCSLKRNIGHLECVTVNSMKSQSTTSILSFGLMIYLINSKVRVNLPRST